MIGSQSKNQSDAQDVKVDGGTSGLLEWLWDHQNRVQVEKAQAEKKFNELSRELTRLEELIDIARIANCGKTAQIVVR